MQHSGSGPGLGTVILVAALTSACVTFGVLVGVRRGLLPGLALAPAQAPSQQAPTGGKLAADVPQLQGVPAKLAAELLDARDLRMNVTHRSPNADIAAGAIVQQSPLPGSLIDPGSTVDVVVSAGPPDEPKAPPAEPEPAGVEVPSVIGMHYRKAVEKLEEAGLAAGRIRETYDEDKRGLVILAQDPEPGTRVEPKSKVDLTRNEDD